MHQFLPYILFGLGFIMIIKGSDWFIDSVIWLAKVLKVPNIIIGATLVSLCTTMPEAMVSVNSALKGNSEIALGNAIGSIACNTGLILGFSILITRYPLKEKKEFQKKGIMLIALLLGLMVFGYEFGEIPRYVGLALLGMLVLYLNSNIKSALKNPCTTDESDLEKDKATIIKMVISFSVGLILTIWGADLLVDNGVIIAKLLGVPDIVIGLSLTAFGTSLPELVTSISAIARKADDLALGNIIGANIMNIILVVGASATILPINISHMSLALHLPFVVFIVLIPVIASFINKLYFSRYVGLLKVITYSLYIVLIYNIN